MTNWYVKDLSRLTKVSVQTLHHYDRIGLLKPSLRLPNGYRLYSEKDLLKLQQIIALKFFGFELSQIKNLLTNESEIIKYFSSQVKFLEEKGNMLLSASQALKAVLMNCGNNKSITWETILKLIEVYHMANQLESTWATKVLNSAELEEYVNFQKELKTNYSANEKEIFEKNWRELTQKISSNMDKSPTSAFGLKIAERCTKMVNDLYGKKYAGLKHSIWKKGFKGGGMGEEHGLTREMVEWLDQAMDNYYRKKIYGLLENIGVISDEEMILLWKNLMTDMYGDVDTLKQSLLEMALKDDKISEKAKNWLRKI
ncbi:MAG: MerR family transcriptional regulator [Gammaproteobacteria bacterium]